MSSTNAQQIITTKNNQLVYFFKALEDSSINESHKTILGINEGWNIYKDIIFPGTTIEGKLKKNKNLLINDSLLSCNIISGDAYNNLFFTYTLAKKWVGESWAFEQANEFKYSMDFFIENKVDCNTPNLSELEGLEFMFQQAMPPFSFLWGLQWSKSNRWCYWNDTKLNDKVKGWVSIPKQNTCLLNQQWNHISIVGHRNNKGLYYDSLLLNNTSFAINIFVQKSYLPSTWAENFLQIGFQINGDKAIQKNHSLGTDPVTVLLNNVNLEVKKR